MGRVGINWVLLAAALGMGGCAAPRMVAPADVASGSRVLEVKDRSSASGSFVDESFQLGKYKIADVDRDATSKKSSGGAGMSSDSAKTSYQYKLKDGDDTWIGSCFSIARDKGAGSISISMSRTLGCECVAKERDERASAQLGGQADTDKGVLKLAGEKYELSTVEETDKSSFAAGPAGYRADKDGEPIAAVEVIRPGRVWINKDVKDADAAPLSCVLAGLMLYQPPSNF